MHYGIFYDNCHDIICIFIQNILFKPLLCAGHSCDVNESWLLYFEVMWF